MFSRVKTDWPRQNAFLDRRHCSHRREGFRTQLSSQFGVSSTRNGMEKGAKAARSGGYGVSATPDLSLSRQCFWGDVRIAAFGSCGRHSRCCLFGCKARWNHSVVTFLCDMFRRGGQTTAINTETHRILQTAFPGHSTRADTQILYNAMTCRRDAIARGIRTCQSKNRTSLALSISKRAQLDLSSAKDSQEDGSRQGA